MSSQISFVIIVSVFTIILCTSDSYLIVYSTTTIIRNLFMFSIISYYLVTVVIDQIDDCIIAK